jgi:endonuclease/exonuclease/phosphatase family metal-dependent hydrolase
MSWNIEMGYKVDEIIEELRRVQPDICLFQEVDIIDFGKEFSLDTAKRIARELNYAGVYSGHHKVSFFFAITNNQYKFGNDNSGTGIWGNAVMSRYPIENPEFFVLKYIQDYDRSFLVAEVTTPLGKIDCCSLHTEVCGG